METQKILVTCGHLQRHIASYEEEIRAHGIEVWVPTLSGQQFTEAEMIEMLPKVDVAIAGDDPLGKEVLEAGTAGRLKGLVRWGIGTDNVDKPTATRIGLPVYNTPGMFSNEVADLALGHVLNLARHLHKMNSDVRNGKWTRYEGMSLAGKTAGVVGLGGIGREVARRCAAFGMKVVGSDVFPINEALLEEVSVKQVAFDEVLRQSDIVIIACNLTPENHHLFDSDAFAKMKHGSMLVNVARGPIVDESALVDALKTGKIGAAGLDVFEVEPLAPGNPLRTFSNCLFGTHSGSSTTEAIVRTNRMSVDIALAMLGIGSERLQAWNRIA